jgi:hypothetical protein
MNAYLFTAGVTCAQMQHSELGRNQSAERLHVWDSCTTAIVCAAEAESAQRCFEHSLQQTPEDEKPKQVEIKRLVAAQFLEPLLTETGEEPIEWSQIWTRIEPTIENEENLDQGYWVDADDVVGPGKLSATLEALQRELPEEIRSGLNWSAERQFFFIISVLSPPAVPPVEMDLAGDELDEEEALQKNQLEDWVASMPEIADKEAAVLVQARNSVVAAWLWRRFAASTPLASNNIEVGPWCPLIHAGN